MTKTSSKRQTARVFTTGTGRVVCGSVILEAIREWPAGYVESFTGVPEDFERPPQGKVEKRRKL